MLRCSSLIGFNEETFHSRCSAPCCVCIKLIAYSHWSENATEELVCKGDYSFMPTLTRTHTYTCKVTGGNRPLGSTKDRKTCVMFNSSLIVLHAHTHTAMTKTLVYNATSMRNYKSSDYCMVWFGKTKICILMRSNVSDWFQKWSKKKFIRFIGFKRAHSGDNTVLHASNWKSHY